MNFKWDFEFIDFVFVVVILFFILVIYEIYKKQKTLTVRGVNKSEIRQRWKDVVEIVNARKELNYKLAVMEADKLLDHVLKLLNFPGNTCRERLDYGCYKHPRLKKVLWAHKVRNKVAHDANYHLRHGETKFILKHFKQALRELDAI